MKGELIMCPAENEDATNPENNTNSHPSSPALPIMRFSFDDPLFMETIMLTVEKMKLENVNEQTAGELMAPAKMAPFDTSGNKCGEVIVSGDRLPHSSKKSGNKRCIG